MPLTTQYLPPPSTVPALPSNNTTRHYHNHMRVAEASYPYYFPQAMTYSFGNEKMIGLGRLTMPISQDTYGFYSLIVFCSDGIYTLGVNRTGDGAYTNVTYSSPEVCLNRKTICEIGGAVFFATDKGLMVLTSQDTGQQFAEHLNGGINFLPALHPQDGFPEIDGNAVYSKILDNTKIVSNAIEYFVIDGKGYMRGNYQKHLSKDDFLDFLKNSDTCIRYISNKRKLLVYNKNFNYSYFIDIKTGCTTKINQWYWFDNGDFPDIVFWNFATKHEFGYLSSGNQPIPCLIQSRPIVVQADDKNSYRFVITGKFTGVEGDWAELVVLSSLDAEHWRVIGIKEKRLEDGFHNIGCVTDRTSWKYLMFIFAGRLLNGSHIDSIDVTVNGRYNNKKR